MLRRALGRPLRLVVLAWAFPVSALAQPTEAAPASSFRGLLFEAIASALALLVGWALLALRKKLQAQAAESTLAQVGLRVTAVVDAVVHDLEATLKRELAKAAEDGELSKAEITHLRQIALERVKTVLGEKGLGELGSVMGIARGVVDQFIQGHIEKSVAQIPSADATGGILP